MTPASYFCGFKLDDCNNHQDSSCSISPSRRQPDIAALRVADRMSRQIEPRHAVLQGALAYCTPFSDSNLPPGIGPGDDGGYTCQGRGAIETQGSQALGDQHQTRTRANLAVRLANHSNRAPLATIVEQGSHSTLNTHASLLGVGRFPSLRAAENTSPDRATGRPLHNPDEKTLDKIQEHAYLDKSAHVMPSADQGCERSHPGRGTDTLARSDPVQHQRIPGFSTPINRRDCDADSKWINQFFPSDTVNVRPPIQYQDRGSEVHGLDSSNLVQRSCSSMVSKGALGTRGRNRKVSMANSESSARIYPLLIHVPPIRLESDSKHGSVRPLPPCPLATRERERCLLADTMLSEPRHMAQENGAIKTTTLSTCTGDYPSAQHKFEDVLVPHNNTSLTEVDGSRYASRNVSFCSTMSTSYSGTVLGVDLDLQHDSAHKLRRSRSATPVWFTPQMAELERQASSSESHKWKQTATTETTCRSITSSALTSLLPIAAASGIVRPNYNTPKISFYSPSGNLIQPESDSPLGASTSEYSGSPTTATSYYGKARLPSAENALSTTIGLPPARPSLLPMTTLPTSTAPLPAHLRHHHNYHRPEPSQILSCESILAPDSAVKGCGGIVRRNNSFSPRSRLAQRHNTHHESEDVVKPYHSTRSMVRSMKSEANFYMLRFINQMLSSSCTPSLPPMPTKSKLLAKRNTAQQGMYAVEPHLRSGIAVAHAGSTDGTNKRPLEDVCGSSTAAHLLRICFCQPYDEAGKRGLCRDAETKVNGHGNPEPNARIARRSVRKTVRVGNYSAASVGRLV